MQKTKTVLAVVGAAALLLVGFDGVTYAATGSSLLLGQINKEKTTTTLTNTGSGAVLNLKASNPKAAPFTTNATGTVKHLNAAGAANAQKLQGQTASQVVSTARQGLVSQVVNRDALQSVNAGDDVTLDSYCQAGEFAVGGSVNIIPDGTGTVITSRPIGDSFGDSPDNGSSMVGWRGVVHADAGGLLDVHVFCAS
jgi:hypothetical protein